MMQRIGNRAQFLCKMIFSSHAKLASMLLFFQLVSSQLSHLNRPNDRNIIPQLALRHECGLSCQSTLEQGIEEDRKIFGPMEFDYGFYETANAFHGSRPGDVLKLEPYNVTSIDLPDGITLFRMQYTSVGLNDTIVPVSAFIALPFTRLQSQKFRLVAFAHGTIGYLPGCAPSSSFNLYDYNTWPVLVSSGYAVVATDYAGLGNNYTSHKYNNPVLNSEDVYFSIVAARHALPTLFTNEWAAIGHSQGGGAVWALSENSRINSSVPGLAYLGSVALAPSPRIFDLARIPNPVLRGKKPNFSYSLFVAWALKSIVPQSPLEFLSQTAKTRIKLINALNLCIYGVQKLDSDLHLGGLSNVSALKEDRDLQMLQDLFGAALGKQAFGPILILQGQSDRTVNPEVTELAWNKTCLTGNVATLSLYPALDHDAIVSASAPEWLAWLDARFSGEMIANSCTLHERKPLSLAAAITRET